MVNLDKITITDYNPLLWGIKPLYKEQAKVLAFINKKFGANNAAFFAIPNDLGKAIKYSTNDLGNNPLPITQLTGDERVKYEKIYNDKRNKLESLIDQLKSNDSEWNQLLHKSLTIPSEDHIYCGNDNVSVSAWGFKTREEGSFGGFSIGRRTPNAPGKPVAEEEPPIATQPPPVSTPVTEEPPIVTPITPTGSNGIPSISTDAGNGQGTAVTPPQTWWQRIKSWFTSWKSCLGSLLLLLLLILLLSWLFDGCNGFSGGSAHLPDEPEVIKPVDPVDVIPDQDSIVNIVGDRLNIVLRGDNKDIDSWAKEFKSMYPEMVYSIIYYDEKTARLQIQIPASERDEIKNALPNQMTDFEMLIWTEQVFQKNEMPTDPAFKDNDKAWYFDVIKAQAAWDYTYGSEEIIIAIIDDGFDISHPELKSRIVKPYNVCEKSSNVFTNKSSTHGTHVAGTALGEKDNNSGICGIAPNCKFMPIQVSDRNEIMTNTAIIDAILYAVNEGADVINMSLGLMIHPKAEQLPPFIQKDIIRNHFKDQEAFWNEIFSIAEAENVVIVLAAGNSNVLVGLDPLQRDPRGIKVNAIGNDIQKAGFSNFGTYSTLSAPGVGVYSSIPNGQFEYMQGTSMASPIVAGAVGLIKSIDNTLSTETIIKILQNTGKPITGSSEIGNLIQLDLAMEAAKTGIIPEMPEDECTNVSDEIQNLLDRIEELKRQCPDYSMEQDTMVIPDTFDDLEFTVGRWKSTSPLVNHDDESVTIFFDFFSDATGIITLVEPDNTACKANLVIGPLNNTIDINQTDNAICTDDKFYNPYRFSCKRGADGYAICFAENKTHSVNKFEFTLVKVNSQ